MARMIKLNMEHRQDILDIHISSQFGDAMIKTVTVMSELFKIPKESHLIQSLVSMAVSPNSLGIWLVIELGRDSLNSNTFNNFGEDRMENV